MSPLIKPNFFIIGAPKCGTSALAHYLGQHPNIFFCLPKEPFFWDTDHEGGRRTHELWTEDDYLKLFWNADPQQHQVIGEGSTTYMQSRVAIQNILEFNPEAKFLTMLRNPVQVAYAMHGELIRHSLEDVRDFEQAWRLQEDRAEGRQLPRDIRMKHQLQYREVATFAPQLQRLFDLVPESNRCVIVFDDLAADTAAVYDRTIRFLGIRHDGRTEFPRVNASRQYRFGWMGRLYHSPPGFLERPMRLLRSRVMKYSGGLKDFVRDAVSKKQPRAALRPEFREELKDEFRADIAATSEMLGRDLTHWTEPASVSRMTEASATESTAS